MPTPKSIIRVNKNGFKFVSSVNRAEYTLKELTRAALMDIGKYITFSCRNKARTIAGKSLRRSKRVKNAFQYWVRKRETDLIVGIKHDTWYGVDQELGVNNQPKRDILRGFVMSHIPDILEIQAKYLKHIEDQLEAEKLMKENEEVGEDND